MITVNKNTEICISLYSSTQQSTLSNKMFKFSLLCLFIVLSAAESSSEDEETRLVDRRYNGLQFGGTAQDYVLLKTRMDNLQDSWSLCGWVKKRLAGTGRFWFAYGTSSDVNEIHSTDTGYLYTLRTGVDMRSRTSVELGVWSHWCYTWTFSTRTAKVYHNGQLLGSGTTTSGRKPGTEGYVVLGQDFDSYGGGFQDIQAFGGDLFKANVFDKELDASEVKEMADGGLCSDVEEKYGRSRYLKWEDLLLEEKSGNVTEVDVGCYPEVEKEESNSTEECDCGERNQTSLSQWDLLKDEKFYNRTVTMEMVEQIKQSWDVLGT